MDLLLVLINANQISPADALRVLDAQRAQQKPIGRLALEGRLLTVRQVFLILARTADGEERFGEAAIALGLLTPGQVAGLLVAQQKPIHQLLVEMGLCAPEMLQRLKRAAPAVLPSRKAA